MKPTFEDISDLRESWETTLSPADYRQRLLAQIETMAVGDPGRAELLQCLASDPSQPVSAETLDFAQAAIDDGGATTIDPRVERVRALKELGRDEEADALVRQLLRSPSRDDVMVGLHASLGEVLEMTSCFKDAQRAYTIGLKDFEPDLDEPDLNEDLCLAGRYRVRRLMGLGSDRFDRCLEEIAPRAAAAIRGRTPAPGH